MNYCGTRILAMMRFPFKRGDSFLLFLKNHFLENGVATYFVIFLKGKQNKK